MRHSYAREKQERKANAALMALPIDNPERQTLRDRFPRLTDEAAIARARKFLTLNGEYLERDRFAKRRNGPFPANVYNVHPTRQSPCSPFESGYNCLPGMEAWADQIRQAA